MPSFDIRDGQLPEALRARLSGEDSATGDPARVASVRKIVEAVRRRGDEAVVEYTARFDKVALTAETLRAPRAQLEASAQACDPTLRQGLEAMIANVRAFHALQKPTSYELAGPQGSVMRFEHRPVRVAALYVPGGTAAYPTTVVMNAVPAQLAGVERIIVLTPPATLESNPAIGATLGLLGLDEVYQVGGAQAIAAAAYGTASIPRADVIVGPGNIFVALAKREVYGTVGIDAVAGPSEVLIIADATAPARLIAADLIAQAEHDRLARCILLTTSAPLIEAVRAELASQLTEAGRREIAAEALREHGAMALCADLAQMVALSNAFAPEHLQVMVDPDAPLTPSDLVAGAIFWGPHSPTAFGDYWAGPNHVLPTSGTARFTGPLSVYTFMRTSSILRYTADGAREAAPRAAAIADAEQLPGHAAALRLRT